MVDLCNYLSLDSEKYLGKVDISGAKKGTYDKVYK